MGMRSRPSSEEALVMWYRFILITRRFSQVSDEVVVHVAQPGHIAIEKKIPERKGPYLSKTSLISIIIQPKAKDFMTNNQKSVVITTLQTR